MNFLLLKLDIAIVTVFFRYSSSFKFNEGLKKKNNVVFFFVFIIEKSTISSFRLF